ncbi:uncharacterized protein LDX57_009047 [Aspergillus melleus]|uniref:uncharacterized protein n=1 Tax=Aspergillus melleus TaxID=138277 RepID=UPI001E8DC29A|nr:uncharacterized protein LDX57_009047 [Aspergillus melleus]KAH8431384.1 hypothetical protein LDX57_009047 [Aspergillus melleus]
MMIAKGNSIAETLRLLMPCEYPVHRTFFGRNCCRAALEALLESVDRDVVIIRARGHTCHEGLETLPPRQPRRITYLLPRRTRSLDSIPRNVGQDQDAALWAWLNSLTRQIKKCK